jgi:hypothetical protein
MRTLMKLDPKVNTVAPRRSKVLISIARKKALILAFSVNSVSVFSREKASRKMPDIRKIKVSSSVTFVLNPTKYLVLMKLVTTAKTGRSILIPVA